MAQDLLPSHLGLPAGFGERGLCFLAHVATGLTGLPDDALRFGLRPAAKVSDRRAGCAQDIGGLLPHQRNDGVLVERRTLDRLRGGGGDRGWRRSLLELLVQGADLGGHLIQEGAHLVLVVAPAHDHEAPLGDQVGSQVGPGASTACHVAAHCDQRRCVRGRPGGPFRSRPARAGGW